MTSIRKLKRRITVWDRYDQKHYFTHEYSAPTTRAQRALLTRYRCRQQYLKALFVYQTLRFLKNEHSQATAQRIADWDKACADWREWYRIDEQFW